MLQFLKAKYFIAFIMLSALGYSIISLNFFTLTPINLVITSSSKPNVFVVDKQTILSTTIEISSKPSTNTDTIYTYKLSNKTYPPIYFASKYITIETNPSHIKKIEIYNNKNKLLASYNQKQFLQKWLLTDSGYKCPSHVLRNYSQTWLNKIIHSNFYFVVAMLIFYMVAVILILPSVYLKKQTDVIELYSSVKNYFLANKKNLFNYFITTYLLITICFIGLAWTNYQYTDDATRFANKNLGWVNDGRILGNFIYRLLNVNLNLSVYNATPYTYFLSTAFLSVACVSLALFYNKKNIYISLAISSLLAIAPFYYEALLFRHDMLIMAFSLTYAVITALVSQKLKPLNAFILQSIALFFLYFMYQPMFLFYIALMSFFICYNLIVNSSSDNNTNKDNFNHTFKHGLASVSSLVLSTIVFKLFGAFFITTIKSNYAKNRTSLPEELGLDYVIKRFNEVITNFFADWHGSAFGYLLASLLVLFLIVICYHFYKTKPKILSIALFKIALFSMFISHSLIFLLNNVAFTRRFFASTNLLVVLPLLYLYNQTKNKYLKNSAIVLTLFILLNNFSMASYLSSSLQKQSQHEAQIKTILEEDIYAYKLNYDPNSTIWYTNTANIVNFYEDPSKKPAIPAINNLVAQVFDFKIAIMMGSFDSYFKNLTRKPNNINHFKNQPYTVVARRKYYDFYYYPSLNKAVVYFKAFTIY